MEKREKKKRANSMTHVRPQDIINVAINAAYVALTLELESSFIILLILTKEGQLNLFDVILL